jgi:aldose 1-epimerase
MNRLCFCIILALLMGSCKLSKHENNNMDNKKNDSAQSRFTDTIDGKPVSLFMLTNKNGMEVSITNYGATVVSIRVADKSGQLDDVVLGHDSIQGYYKSRAYFGCVVGRFANRIANGKFKIDGNEYSLAQNNGPNTLHGGTKGFDKQVWVAKQNPGNLELSYTSKDGEEGYPGNLQVTITYTLTDQNELKIAYDASTDKSTIINLSNHSYFNLAGQGKGDILGHQLTLYADTFTPVDSTLIPTGEIRKVKGTAFDFTSPHTIGERIDAKEEQLIFGKGYDHNFVINGKAGELRPAARVSEASSGRVMEVFTTEPGVQFYCGNFLDGSEKGKGSVYNHRNGFCLETQQFPDSPNQPEFPSAILKPGEKFHSETVYKFSAL